MSDSKLLRMNELVSTLNEARESYESSNVEIMTNAVYDALFDELESLEKETGIVLENSPTHSVGFEAVNSLVKEKHPSPMLSQAKTKSVDDLAAFLGDKLGVLSRKMDGLTIVLHYNNGKLVKAVTRGNGIIGEIVTHNAKVFDNLPGYIGYDGELVMRGEAVILYSDFLKVNEAEQGKYKNPRNLCSGSVRQLDSRIAKSRHIRWYAFELVSAKGAPIRNSVKSSFDWMKSLGFDVVDHEVVDADTVANGVSHFEDAIENCDIPSDGLVLIYDDIEYGNSLGYTTHNPRNSIAFKWTDEIKETTLLSVFWSVSKTGLINPVAVFEGVELEGTTVQRASLHNVSIFNSLKLGVGDTITVYKANMIIPQVSENLTGSDTCEVPDVCPVCGQPTHLHVDKESGVQTLYCENTSCPARRIATLSHFTSRDAMNIVGISEHQIEDLISQKLLSKFADFYKLAKHADIISSLPGWGEKSCNNLLAAIDESREVNAASFLYALSIPMIGRSTAKLICNHFNDDIDAILSATQSELLLIDGIGDAIAESFVNYINDDSNYADVYELLSCLRIKEDVATDTKLSGMTFVITGTLTRWARRDDLVNLIESLGGKVASSVSKNTTVLINNDVNSKSSKNKKAHDLGVPVLSEEDFISEYNIVI